MEHARGDGEEHGTISSSMVALLPRCFGGQRRLRGVRWACRMSAVECKDRRGQSPAPYGRGSGGHTEAVVAYGVQRVSEQEPVRIPREVLEELKSVRRYTRAEVLDIPTVRHVAMETEKPALVVWIDEHEHEYGRGLLNGFRADD